MNHTTHCLAIIIRQLILLITHLFTGARALWSGDQPTQSQTIYYGNHTSHGDFLLIWASLPKHIRRQTRPVAAADYWEQTALRRFIITHVFNAVLIYRERRYPEENLLAPAQQALNDGYSLIFFPEGKRNQSDVPLLEFRKGIYHLVIDAPKTQIMPVWIENINRSMPKGHYLPLPILCTLTFGHLTTLKEHEEKNTFVERLRENLLHLKYPQNHSNKASQ